MWTIVSFSIAFLFFVQPGVPREQLWMWARSHFKSDFSFYFWGSLIIHWFFYFGANLVMYLIYHVNLPFFESYRIRKQWPWEGDEEKRKEWRTLVLKSVALTLFNHLFILVPGSALAYDNFILVGGKMDVDSIPPWYVSMLQIGFFMVVEDTIFYFAHRTLHHPAIYQYMHKWHHQYKETVGIAAEYAHPMEYLLANMIPTAIGPLLCGAHLYTFFMWLILRIGETIDGHCGYEFPWSPYRLIPFSGSASVHDFHHSHNVGNFASFFTWWDRICGTDHAWVEHLSHKKADTAKAQ